MRIPTITQETIPGPYAISENTNRLNILATLTKQDPIYIYDSFHLCGLSIEWSATTILDHSINEGGLTVHKRASNSYVD